MFGAGVYAFMGRAAGLEFFAGYLIEKALSVDNIFVFVMIFGFFRVPLRYQHRVLFWGILGALVMRGAMIVAGAYLIQQFHWIMYVFGAFLVFTGIRMATQTEHDIEPEANPVIRLVRRLFPVTDIYHGQKFFVRKPVGGRPRLVATPLFVVLALVETTDLLFAVDSIPAIFAVTQDSFIVYSSNVFAILGSAGAVLSSGRRDRSLSLSQGRTGGGPGVCRGQDAGGGRLQDTDRVVARRGRAHARGVDRRVTAVAASD